MEDNQIIIWLKQARSQGLSDTEIKDYLRANGWADDQIADLLYSPVSKFKINKQIKTTTDNPSDQSFESGLQYGPQNYTPGSHIFSRAWAIVKQYWKTMLIAIIPLTGMSLLFFFLGGGLTSNIILFIFSYLIFWCVMLYFQLVMTVFIGREERSVNNAFSISFKMFFNYLLTMALAGLIMLGGFMLLFVPGILMALAFTTLPYIIVREEKWGWAAITRAYCLAKNFRGMILGDLLVLWLFSVLIYSGVFIILILLALASNALGLTGTISNIFSFSLMMTGVVVITAFLPAYSLAYYKIIYQDLVAIRPYTDDDPLTKRGKKLGIIYLAIGIIILISQITMYAFGTRSTLNSVSIAQDAARKSDLQAIRIALVSYSNNNNGAYPVNLSLLVPNYLKTLPTDPKSG